MKVLIISGFLGAGKTTFIKELIRHTGQQIVVLENEYGEVNLDAKEIRSVSDMKVYEFSDGCICCTMKDGFVSSLLTISASLDPDVLVVEPTGVGKLSSIVQNVRNYEYERIRLLRPVTVVSPDSFAFYRERYPEIYLDQIENASEVVFSKCEQAGESELSALAEQIHEISPQTRVRPRHYMQNEPDWWDSLLGSESDRAAVPTASLFVSDRPVELTLRNAALPDPGRLVLLMEELIHGAYGEVIRAKGVVRCGAFSLRFDVADGRYAITEAGPASALEADCVFIGEKLDEGGLKRFFGKKQSATLFRR